MSSPLARSESDSNLRKRNDSESSVGSGTGSLKKIGKSDEDAPVSLIAALHSKYSTSSVQSMHCTIRLPPNAPGRTESGHIRVPEILILDSFNITWAGLIEDLSRICSHVVELDLTKNSLTSWTEVFTAAQCMTHLDFLNLTKNPLDQLSTVNGNSFPDISKLALNFTSLSWLSIQCLLKIFPNLTELYLSGNGYTDVSLDLDPYPSLKLLQLTSNRVDQWNDLTKLDKFFPGLNNLIIADNNIVTCGCPEQNKHMFKKLRILNMNNTGVAQWDELEKLNKFAQLIDIRLVGIPLAGNLEEKKRRQLMSLYFPNMKLNGSAISSEGIEAAERAFIRHFMNDPVKPKFYEILESKHGKLDALPDVSLAPKEHINLAVICGKKCEYMDISTKQTIGQLKKFLRPYVGTSKFRLFRNCGYGPTEELRTSNRLIWALNWIEDDKLHCEPMD